MSALDWIVAGVIVWLGLCGLAVVGISRWGRHMAAKNQLLTLDRELDKEITRDRADQEQ